MDNNRASLIKRVLSKESVLTSFEVIHLEYLNRKGILKQLLDIENQSNPYEAVRNIETIISPFYMDWIKTQATKADPEFSIILNSVYRRLWDLDDNIGIFGYKGIALLTQLTSIRHEHFVNFVLNDDSEKTKKEITEKLKDITSPPIFSFSTYSFVHQKEVTFTEVLHTLTLTFKTLIQITDNILTLNYYLDRLIELEDLDCLRFLKMWLNDGTGNLSEDDEKPFFNAALIHCNKKDILFILSENHKSYVDYLKNTFKNIPASFEENSLQYVKETIALTINSVTKTENNIKLL